MLGVVPVRRKNAKTVLGWSAWNLLVLAPFIIAFWILTEKDHGSNRSCYGIPWDVANFTRWALLGSAIYVLASIPLNMMAIKQNRKLGRESRLHHWMQMFDTLNWLFNWAVFFHLVTGLANRHQCHNRQIKDLLWATVFFSAFFALVGLIIAIIGIAKYIGKLLKEIKEEAKARTEAGTDVLGARAGLGQASKAGGVEILDVRKSNVESDINRVRPDQAVMVGRERRQINEEVMDKGDRGIISNTGIPDDKYKRERADEIINIGADNRAVRGNDIRGNDLRDDVVIRQEVRREVVQEVRHDGRSDIREDRLDLNDSLPTNTHNVRTHDFRAGNSQRKI